MAESDMAEQAPAEGGQGDAEAVAPSQGTEASPAAEPAEQPPPERSYLEVEDPVNTYVRVKAGDEEIEVPFAETQQGYLRQADYTRKTQELAEQRDQAQYALRLQQAFEQDPAITVQLLARQAGMSVEEFVGLSKQEQITAVAEEAEPTFDDPLERELYEERKARLALEDRFNQQLELQEQQRADQQVRGAVDGLKQELGATDDDIREVVQAAMAMRLGPQFFPMIFHSLAHQKAQVANGVQSEVAQADAADDAARRAAVQAANGVIGQGTGATNVTTEAPSDGRMSLIDAFNDAFEKATGA